ncbi:hypothetical protein GCM10010377_48630 [Streptomyces viridiviolaceus]|nr:hypothetical protein GCM10010377_48630 [Streptomyces viridiviolaceus]
MPDNKVAIEQTVRKTPEAAMNLGRYVRRTSEHHPDAEEVACGRIRSTYPALDDHSDRPAAALTEACFRKTPA